MTAPLPADFPIRPGFWNVPLWGEIGVYVAAVITIALCAWGVCKNIEVWRRRKDEKLPSDPSRRDRLLKEAVLEEKVRQTSAGRMHAVLVVGFFLLFLGTATATLDWDVGHYVFGKQFLRPLQPGAAGAPPTNCLRTAVLYWPTHRWPLL